MLRRVWFRLLDGRGGTQIDKSCVWLDAVIVDIQAAVKQAAPNRLATVDASDLVIYAHAASFERKIAVDIGNPIDGIGISHQDPVIVQVRAPRLAWKPAPDPASSLLSRSLNFVNRDRAVERLREAHELCFIGATTGVRDERWPIALADNELGMTFAQHYIRRCKEAWPAKPTPPGFRESLSAARMLRVVVGPQKFVEAATLDAEQTMRANVLDETVNSALAKAVQEELSDTAPLPSWLTSPPVVPGTSFVEKLVKELGPVFIVLDEIGQGFTYDGTVVDAEERARKLFIDFCASVLITWMNTPGVYFVLTGFAPFLRKVGTFEDHLRHRSRGFKFVRLNLQSPQTIPLTP